MIETDLRIFKNYRWHIPKGFGRCPICHSMYKGEVFEPLVVKEALKYIKEDKSVIDGGACLGQMSVLFSEAARHVYSFEAIPDIYEILLKNLTENNRYNVDVFNNALWHVFDEDIFFESDSKDTFGGGKANMMGGRLRIKSKTIDNLQATDVSFIKLDIEGAELNALQGAVNTISLCRPTIIFECNGGISKGYGGSLKEIKDFFNKLEYTVSQLNINNFIALPF